MPDVSNGRQISLADLLCRSYATPGDFMKTYVGAGSADVIALCLHCMMVDYGFTPLDMDDTKKPLVENSFKPPSGWNSLQDEWIITYLRESSPSRFRLHCAVQASTGRLFVHASESDLSVDGPVTMKASNIQVLGLQLENYVFDLAGVDTPSSWEECVKNERTLKEMFNEFVMIPLWGNASRDATSLSEKTIDDQESIGLYNVSLREDDASWYDDDRDSRIRLTMPTVFLVVVGIAGTWYLMSKARASLRS